MQPRPGDIGATRGGGWVGRIIRHGTAGPAHTLVWIRPLMVLPWGDQLWLTHEAFGSRDAGTGRSGIRSRLRLLSEEPVELVTVARTDEERAAALTVSWRCVEESRGYGWSVIVQIALRLLERFLVALHLGLLARPLRALRAVLRRHADPLRMICSTHCALVAVAARPELLERLPYPPEQLWPDALMTSIQALAREDWELQLSSMHH